ncbi:MAG: phosphatase PAP2 family protein [Pirellulaceae bacterium]
MAPGQNLPRRYYFWAAVPLVLLALFVLPADFRISLALRNSDALPGDLRKAIQLSEVFAHSFGVAFILLAISVLDRRGWSNVARIAACAYLPGLVASAGKLLIARRRPTVANLDDSVLASFAGWIPVIRTDGFSEAFDHAMQSFPSGHTATAVGLAIGLSYAYPRGRYLFPLFAVLAGLQRVVAGAHFPSDVFAGAAVACLLAPLFAPRQPSALRQNQTS